MNRYFLIRRLRWPAVLLLGGSIALLNQIVGIDHPWRLFISLLLIVMGLLLLAERMSLTADGDFPAGYPGSPNPGSPYVGTTYTGAPAATTVQPTPAETTSIVPASHDFGDSNGGQS
jgi:hypothetical protein